MSSRLAGAVTLSFTSNEAVSGAGFLATISTACPAGTYSNTGHTIAAPCTACPPGRFGRTMGATSVAACLACPPSLPYSSPPYAASACTDCTSGCDGGGIGAALCPGPQSWLPWAGLNAGGSRQGVCLLLTHAGQPWAAAAAVCTDLAPGATLLTTPQVKSCARDNVLPTLCPS
jgi:hypothetical protein